MSREIARMTTARITAAVLASITLSACGNPYVPIGPGPETVRLTGWIGNAPAPSVQPVHCYATLAVPDCYAVPQRISNRWIGSYVTEEPGR
jgi:hypothetical protein